MNRLLFSAVFGTTIAIAAVGTANAAPISMTPTPATENAVEKVHGYHRDCRGDPDYLHRHARSGERIECGRRYHYRDRYYYRDSGPGITLRFGRDRDHRYRRDWD